MKESKFALLLMALCLAGVGGCGGTEEITLKLFCGGGIRPPVSEIIKAFEEETGVKVKPTYAGSGVLLTQIQLTKEGDLYMPGDEMFISRAEEMGLVVERRNVAYFIPVLLVQKGNPKRIRSISDMGEPGIKVGMGDPEACAIGEVARAILRKNGIERQAMRNVVYTSVTVVELANAVKLGTIDVAIVWDATAFLYRGETESIPIPLGRNVIARIPIGVLSFSKHKKLARKFMEFITSDEGRRIFEKHGYTTKLR